MTLSTKYVYTYTVCISASPLLGATRLRRFSQRELNHVYINLKRGTSTLRLFLFGKDSHTTTFVHRKPTMIPRSNGQLRTTTLAYTYRYKNLPI